LVSEDRVEDVVCLNVMHDSVEPLGIVMANADKLFPTFKVKSSQEFIITPVVS
jgi:hypothetical protein